MTDKVAAPSASPTTASAKPQHSTSLRQGAVGVAGILFFVLSAQAPLTGIAGALPLTILLGNGAGAPGAYLLIGAVIVLFAVGFIAMSRRVDAKGAFYAYVGAGIGRKAGTGSAWLALLAYATVQAAMYGLYGASVAGLLASIGLTVPWWLPVLITIAVVQLLGSLNIELGAKVLAVFVGLEVAVLLAFSLGVLFTGGGPEGETAALCADTAADPKAAASTSRPASLRPQYSPELREWHSCSLSHRCSASSRPPSTRGRQRIRNARWLEQPSSRSR